VGTWEAYGWYRHCGNSHHIHTDSPTHGRTLKQIIEL